MTTVAILPLDMASVVVPVPDTPELVLKHIDGGLVRVHRDNTGSVVVSERDEYSITWYKVGRYDSLEGAISAAADIQAFALQRGGEPSSILEATVTGSLPRAVLEIVPLDIGGIIVDDQSHLPLVFHLTTGEYWRISTLPDDEYPEYQLEYREDDVSSWERVGEPLSTGAAVDALPVFLEEIGIEYITEPSASAISDVIESHDSSFIEEVPDKVPEGLSEFLAVQERRLDWGIKRGP